MASSIVQLSGIISGDKCIRLDNSRTARLHGILPAQWTTLRLGFRVNFSDNGGTLFGGPAFRFGFCSGVDNIVPGSTGHAYYYQTIISSWLDGTLSSYPNYKFYNLSGSNAAALRKTEAGTDSLVAFSGASSTQACMWAKSDQSASSTYWSNVVFFDLTKATTSGDLGVTFDSVVKITQNTSDTNAFTDASVLAGMEVTDPDDITAVMPSGASVSTGGADTGEPTSEVTFGAFDSVFWSWNKSSVVCNIGSVFVAVIA